MTSLVGKAAFSNLRKNGIKTANSALILVAGENLTNENVRVAFAIKKQLGSAVERNRIKRRIRQILVSALKPTNKGKDLLIIAKPKAFGLSFEALEQAMSGCLAKVMK